jgi:hypothetical protein
MNMFRGKTIGLIWDKHTSHYSDEVMEFVERCNADKATTTRIVIELVDEGLTPIIQVPDVAVNKVFKAAVKERYHKYRSTLPVNIGQKVSVPCETLFTLHGSYIILDSRLTLSHCHPCTVVQVPLQSVHLTSAEKFQMMPHLQHSNGGISLFCFLCKNLKRKKDKKEKLERRNKN